MSIKKIVLHGLKIKATRPLFKLLFGIIAWLKHRVFLSIKYNVDRKCWEHYENGQFVIADFQPNWNFTRVHLSNQVQKISYQYYQPHTGDIIVDVGAGIGTETVIYSEDVRDGKVFAIEAHPETFDMLKLQHERGMCQNVEIMNLAIGDRGGRIKIDTNSNHAINSIFGDNNGPTIMMTTLDELIQSRNLEKVSLLKINIEGAEKLAIIGLSNSVHLVENMLISCHDVLYYRGYGEHYRTKSVILDFLKKNNFEILTNSNPVIVDDWVYATRKI